MAIGTTITLEGAKLLAKALNGKELKFTRGAFGDAIVNGSMKTPTVAERDALNALIHEKMSLPITGYEIVDDQIIVSLQVKNDNVTADFRIAEMGLFAKDPDSNQEKLYGYAFAGNDGDKMHAANTDVQLEFQVELVTKICGAKNVTAVITRTYIGLQQEDLDAHIASSLPHPNWEVVKAGVGLSKSNDTLNVVTASTSKLGGIKVGKNLYMEGDSLNASADDTSDIDSRLKRIEINQANLYILLESLHKFGVQANTVLIEDFQTLKATRFLEHAATVPSAGKAFNVDNISSLRETTNCVITNGRLFNQLITIDKISRTGGVYSLTADSNITSKLTVGTTVQRSTVTIKDDKAHGAGLIKVKTKKKNKVWKGESGTGTQQAPFNAYESLASSFELEGDWSLTSNGYFTLG